MMSLTGTSPGRRSWATTLQLMSCSVAIPIGRLFSSTMTLPTSARHMARAASATVALKSMVVGLWRIISLSCTLVSRCMASDDFIG